MWRTDDVQRGAAWRLIFHATSDRGLADDWCDDLAEVMARLPADEQRLDGEQLMTWLHASPAPHGVRGAVMQPA